MRNRLIRLGNTHPELRPHLRKILAAMGRQRSRHFTASDPVLEAVADIVRSSSSMMSIDRDALKRVRGIRDVDFSLSPVPVWTLRTRNNRKIGIVSIDYVETSPEDIVVGNLVVGYL